MTYGTIKNMKRLKNHPENLCPLPDSVKNLLKNKNLTWEAVEFEKGEIITKMQEENNNLLLVFEGSFFIHGIKENGDIFPIVLKGDLTILGNIEFLLQLPSPYFTQAASKLKAIRIPIQENRNLLEKDCDFLLYLAQDLAQKQIDSSSRDLENHSVQERIILYMNSVDKPIRMSELESNLHLSRRHLYRMLDVLMKEKKVEKIKRGYYQLSHINAKLK